MRIRVSFEYGAGVCLWADDEAARERWCSAVEFAEAGLEPELTAEGTALLEEVSRSFVFTESEVKPCWTAAEEQRFHARASEWTERVRAALAPHGITVADYGAEAAPLEDEPVVDGRVVACFADERASSAAAERFLADSTWRESATWLGYTFAHRGTERAPADLLLALEAQPGFVCGWWQEREGGDDAMLAGDPVEHAIACVRERNATGLANFLSWLHVQRVHLGEPLAGLAWQPGKRHRLADARGSFWEWWSFLRNATAAIKGGRPSDRYLAAERERLQWRWTHGGGRQGWPAGFGEAIERVGLRREAFNRWAC